MNIMQMRRGMGKNELYTSKVAYIDISGSQIITNVDAINIGGLDFSFTHNYVNSATLLGGGNFALWESVNDARLRIRAHGADSWLTTTNMVNTTNKIRVASNNQLTAIVVYGRTTYSLTPTAPLSSTSGFIRINNSVNIHYLYQTILYDISGNVLFNGIPVRIHNKGALYDPISDIMYVGLINDWGYGPDIN